MSLEFLRDSPDVAFRQTIRDLKSMNPKYDAGVFENMSIPQIDTLMERLEQREHHLIDELPYGTWLTDPTFVQIKLLQDGLSNLREHIEVLEETEQLVKGFIYYADVSRFGDRVDGRSCIYLGEGRPANWINFIDSAPILKTLEVINHGDDSDFRRLYIEIANGRPDGLENVSIEHIVESTDDALRLMESYCDARWEGPWAWETKAPYKLHRIIEEINQMRKQTVSEMRQLFQYNLQEMYEGSAENFDIMSTTSTMSETVQAMIEKFAKLAGDALINLKAMVLTKLGDEAAMKVEHGLTQSVNNAADALAHLKVDIDALNSDLQGHSAPGLSGMGGGMGGDPSMGGNPQMGGGDPSMGGDPQMGGGDPSMGGDDMGMPANDNAAQMGGGANAAMPPPPGTIEPERPRKKA